MPRGRSRGRSGNRDNPRLSYGGGDVSSNSDGGTPRSNKSWRARRRKNRSKSRDSDDSIDVSFSEIGIIEPPSYNQPAYSHNGSQEEQGNSLNNSNNSAHRRRKFSRDSDEGYNSNSQGYNSLEDDSDHQANNRIRQQQQQQQYQQQQQQQQQEYQLYPQENTPTKRKKKGLRNFLSAGIKQRRNKSDDSLSSRNSAPVTPQYTTRRRASSHESDTEYAEEYSHGNNNNNNNNNSSNNNDNNRARFQRGIPNALSYSSVQTGYEHHHEPSDFQDPSYGQYEQGYSDRDGHSEPEYDRDGYSYRDDSHEEYTIPVNLDDDDDNGTTKPKGGLRNRRMQGARVVQEENGDPRNSLNQSEHLQIDFASMDGSRDGSADTFFDGTVTDGHSLDPSYDSGEFSLEMEKSGRGGGHNHRHTPGEPVDYKQLSRHKKDLASQNLQAIESMARKDGYNPVDEAFRIYPDDAYPNTKMTRRELRKNMDARSAFYHDLRLQSQNKKELGQIHLEVLQCFGLPTTSLVREVSAYAVAVHGSAAFQTDVIPNVANPMWLSKMRRACVFPVQNMYSQLSIGIFDLEAAYADPSTVIGHPGHPGWVPTEQRGFLNRSSSFVNNRGNSGSFENRRGSSGSMHRGSIQRSGSMIMQRGSSVMEMSTDDEDDRSPPTHLEPAAYCTRAEDFIGHVTIDICRLRPGSTYDVTLPLRRSKHIFTREPQGSVRVRLHLGWHSERSAVMSYLPMKMGGTVNWQKQPNNRYTVNCVDDRSARNVAHAVHGIHMPGKFDMTLLKSTIREIHWTRIHLFRYVKNREIYHLKYWVYPSISGFVFFAWMHAVYFNTVRYIPGHVVVFFLLHLVKNYAYYAMNSPLQNGFLAPTLEELYLALISGTKKRKKPCIEPLTVEREADAKALTASDHNRLHSMDGSKRSHNMDELYDENGNLVHVSRFPLAEIAEAMKKSLETRPHRKGFTVFKHTFQGDDAVDFLIMKGFAMTRPEAVSVGRRLEREKRLFQHIAKDFMFEDSNYIYCLLDTDTDRYLVQNTHVPRGAKVLEWLGFYSSKRRAVGRKQKGKLRAGGADILESREHVEFPFATGVDHPRFTVKESLVIRSAEEKTRLKREDEAKSMAEVAEFGIVPSTRGSFVHHGHAHGQAQTPAHGVSGYDSEHGTSGNVLGRTARRGSMVVGTALSSGATAIAAGATAMTETLAGTIRGNNRMNNNNNGSQQNQGFGVEVATGEEMYIKLKEQNNATLDRVMALQRKADEYDPYQYDSDNDVKTIQRKKRKKYVILEKHLKKPISQEIGNNTTAVDMTLAKSLEKTKRHVSAFFYHMFDDQLYKIDKNVFPIRLETNTENQVKKKKKRGLFNRRVSIQELKEEEERQKKSQMTPYEQQQEEIDKVLMINQYSHWNPWINRIAIVMQPLLEMAQTFLFAFRALFNIFTWQDPVLCFWLCVAGPPLAVVLYAWPYRIFFAFLGIYWIGPQNYFLRIYRESKDGYEPPDFDLIVKTKKLEKVEDFQEMQFFSSEAPGNQQIRFRNIDPAQVKQIIVPSNVMMYGSRFYDWPPEPKYARVYASEAPKNLIIPGFAEDHHRSGYDSDSVSTYVFDQAARKKSEEEREKIQKKKRKKNQNIGKKMVDGLRKTGQLGIGVVETAGGAVVQGSEHFLAATGEVTVGAVKGTAQITKSVVKGTSKQAKSAAKGTGNFLRLRKRHKKKYGKSYSDDEDGGWTD